MASLPLLPDLEPVLVAVEDEVEDMFNLFNSDVRDHDAPLDLKVCFQRSSLLSKPTRLGQEKFQTILEAGFDAHFAFGAFMSEEAPNPHMYINGVGGLKIPLSEPCAIISACGFQQTAGCVTPGVWEIPSSKVCGVDAAKLSTHCTAYLRYIS